MEDILNKQQELDSMFSTNPIPVSLDTINDMNIIINDSDCSDLFFDDVCSNLSNQGLKFDITRNSVDIDEDEYTIITLDQQYNSGYGSLIFAPYDNTRLGDSDSLALCMKASMIKNGIVVENIISGRVGFRKDEQGNVTTLVPTESEDKIESDKSTSFVTISLGTQNPSVEMVADSIFNALMRQRYYLDNYDSHTDLLYRADSGEQVDVVANYFGASVNDLSKVNQLKDLNTLEAQTIINPSVREIAAFDPSAVFEKQETKAKSI